MKRLKGHIFELANLLCSLLLGAGFDCYMVSGYASLDVTSKNLMRNDSPYIEMREEDEKEDTEIKEKKYKMNPPRDLRSKFILMMQQKEIDKINRAKEEEEEKLKKIQEEIERPPFDPLDGQRKHAWVLMAPNVKNSNGYFFIEPTTGLKFDLNYQYYYGIESIWNHENYWVNLQEPVQDLSQLDYDLSNAEKWEHLLLGEPIKYRKIDMPDDADEDEQNLLTIMDEKHLDMPYYWSEPIDINYKMLSKQFPNGSQKVHYKRTIVEEYAQYVQTDGLVTRVNRYHDFYCSPDQLYSIEEIYKNRSDKLIKVIRNLETNEITEYFRRGRDDQAKKHRYHIDTISDPEKARYVEYYTQSRHDGLIKIELTDTTMTEYFTKREDRIIYKCTTYCQRGKAPPGFVESHRRIIAKIVEKYDRDESIPAVKDIAIREFCMVDNIINLKFHYDKGCVTATTRSFIKPPISEMGENLTFNPDRTYGYVSEVGAKPPSALYLYTMLLKQLKEEEVSVLQTRDTEDQLAELVRVRDIERAKPKLTISLFNREHNKELMLLMKKQEQEEQSTREREVEEEVDYLAPCLAKLEINRNIKHLNYAQATAVKRVFKEFVINLLINRANDIQTTFDKTTQELAENHAWYSSVQDTLTFEEEELYFQEVRDKSFYLHTLEIRLARHRDLSNSRYESWMAYMEADPRMMVLKQRKN